MSRWLGLMLALCSVAAGCSTSTSEGELPQTGFFRRCGTDISVSDLKAEPAALRLGPLTLAMDMSGLDIEAAATPDGDGRVHAFKIVTQVEPGSAQYVWMGVDPDPDSVVALAYNTGRSQPKYALEDGDQVVALERCNSGTPTVYNGGFVAFEPVCVRIRVWEDPSADAQVFELPFRRDCV